MLLTNRFSFFDKSGNNSNPVETRAISVNIIQEGPNYGYGASINAYADVTGSITYVEILNSGKEYSPTAYLQFVDINSGKVWNTPPSAIGLGPEGEIVSYTIPVDPENTLFTYPSNYYYSVKYLDPVSTGLIATDHLFVLENVFDANGRSAYAYPRVEEYGPFEVSEYSGNGTTGKIKIQTQAFSGTVFSDALTNISSIPPGIISQLKPGMYIDGPGINFLTTIVEVDTSYNYITLSQPVTSSGNISVEAYFSHDLRVGNIIRIYDSVGTTPLDGEYTVVGATAKEIYFNTNTIVPLTVSTTARYGVIPIYKASFALGSDQEFFLFTVDYNVDYPTITKQKELFFTFANASTALIPDSIPVGTNTLYQRTVFDRIQKEAFQLNIGLQAEYEGVYNCSIRIDDATYPELRNIVSVQYEGETIAEDERLGLLLENFGRDVTPEQELIFRDSDVNEDLVNNSLLNTKRKEMLLQGEEIWPYVGSYRGLVNIVNWFGYYDIRIKEYWLNVNQEDEYFGKYRQMQIPFQLKDKAKNSEAITLLPSKHYKKTNLFGLFYDLVKDGGTFDINGVPETVDAFEYTNEEILIKLFALKRYLRDKFLPLNTRIVDITGEGVYYERYAVNSWNDNTQRIVVNLTRDIDFKAEQRRIPIQDARPFDPDASILSPPYFGLASTYFNKYNIKRALISNPGGPYYGEIPTVSFPGQSVQPARGIVRMKAQAIAVIAPLTPSGTGYQVGDVITLAGGTYEAPIRLTVNLVGPLGEVLNFGINSGFDQGSNYSAMPTSGFSQASVYRPQGNQYVAVNATGFNLLATDIPFQAESVVLYDLGLQYSDQPTIVFLPAIGGISATLDVETVQGPPIIYYNNGAPLEPYVDSPNIPVAGFIDLSTAFDITWDEVPYRWVDMGGGSDATLKSWISPLPSGTGQLLAVEILSPGSDYRYPPNFLVSGGGGTGGSVAGDLKNGKLKILEYTVTALGNSIGVNDVLTLSPTMPLGGINAISAQRIVKGSGIPDGTIISIANQPFSEIYLTNYDGAPVTTTINIGDKVYIHQGAFVTTNGGGYEFPPNIAPNGGHVGTLYTWDELGRGDMYQMEWVVTLTRPDNPTHVFNYRSGMKTIDELITHTVKVPYSGFYTIELVVYDTDNNWINEIKNDYIEVYLPEATFAYAVKYINECADTWDEFYQPPIPEFEPTPNQLSPALVEGIRYDWDKANGRWVNPVFTLTTWEDSRVNWDTLELGNLSSVNSYTFAPTLPIGIIQVSPEDNLEGRVLSYTDANTTPATVAPTITVSGQRAYPQIEPAINPNDWIFIRRDNVTYQLEVLSSNYTTPGITVIQLFTTPPEAFRNSPSTWEVLREIGGTVVVDGNQIYDPTFNPTGIAIGEYVRIAGIDDIPKTKRVPIEAKDNYVGLPNWIELSGGGTNSIYYPGGELGQIYKFRGKNAANGNLNWNPTANLSTWWIEPSTSSDPLVSDHVGKVYILDANPTPVPPPPVVAGCQPAFPSAEIRPGFTILHLYVTIDGILVYDQRLRTTHAYFDTSNTGHPFDIWNGSGANYQGVHVIDVVGLDGGKLNGLIAQLTTWAATPFATVDIWMEYEYDVFPTRTYQGFNSLGNAQIYMDFNMYPSSGEFANATLASFPATALPDTGWYYDHGIASGDYTMLVTNTGVWRNGAGTIITVDDSESELMRSSSSFKAYQRDFDEDTAERRLGTLVQTWENYRPLLWDESCFHTWDTLDNQERISCFFKIRYVDQNGTIQFNNDPQFLFQGIVGGMNTAEKFSQALYELQNTDNPGLSRFDYVLDGVWSTNPSISPADLEYFYGQLDTYNWPDLIIAPNFPGALPSASNDVVVSPYTASAAKIATYPFVGPTLADIRMASNLPKKLQFIGDVTAGSPFIRNVQGLLEEDLYVGEIITGTGLPVSPAVPAQVLEIIATGGHVRQIKLSTNSAITLAQNSYNVEWDSKGNNVAFTLVFKNGSPTINGYAKTPSVDQLGWLLGQNNVLFADPFWNLMTPICHTYPLKNVKNQFGYGLEKIGAFQGGITEFLQFNRYFQVYQYEGINPLGLPYGWYPASSLAPQYSYLTNNPFPAPPAIDNVENAEVQSNRLPYESAIGGTWRWEDTWIGIEPTRVPSGSVVLFTADASSIAGKTRYFWRIYENDTILVETIDSSILWTFPYDGRFTVELEITDTNGNQKKLNRKDFITVYERI